MNENNEISKNVSVLVNGLSSIIESAKQRAAVFLNTEVTALYWHIGHYINTHLKENDRLEYGSKILATLSQELTNNYGKGFSYSALTRMCKVATCISEENIATVSQQLSWSHLVELSTITDDLKREYYLLLASQSNWGVRQLREEVDKMLFERTALAKLSTEEIKTQLRNFKTNKNTNLDIVFKNTYVLDFLNLPSSYTEKDLERAIIDQLERFILELGNGFSFIERQKRIPVDGEDYHLDLLFYHRKLKRLIAVDLKLGRFKPSHKGQMELYLSWLERNEMEEGENKPIGLLLCSEGNTEHIEMLMLNESEIKVAQYVTALPDKKWFADKLQKAKELAQIYDSK